MSDREDQRLDFLSRAGLADAARTPLPGDASTRRYERLKTADGQSLILMDQPPAEESAVAPEDAVAHFGWIGGFFALDLPASSKATRERYGWTPSRPTLLEDLDAGHYPV